MSDLPLHEQVGFDYVATVRELLERMSWMDLALSLGYEGNGSIHRILQGSIPSHVRGEALWALYISVFGRKPPLGSCKSGCASESSSV